MANIFLRQRLNVEALGEGVKGFKVGAAVAARKPTVLVEETEATDGAAVLIGRARWASIWLASIWAASGERSRALRALERAEPRMQWGALPADDAGRPTHESPG